MYAGVRLHLRDITYAFEKQGAAALKKAYIAVDGTSMRHSSVGSIHLAGQQADGPGLSQPLVKCFKQLFGSSFRYFSTQVLCVRRFEEESEAVEAANSSEFGLAAAVMSSDKDRYDDRPR